ncbi:hypothetical protein PtrSN002B_000640 [Pyrenophora tritici-repentis]|uniref:Herpes-BLLF1 domain containing protein n=2 Tax=Pyrenophora tritici-repentis TaxID=45151 RepID=A0A2W1EKB7_9PLEO|nr:uncharacterized protein PTRG_03567 [Pyrenophora tritici-repentis Pt-1C-BFP]KAA8620382.1 hypothetical protein PtrV1_07476 [Pyrenophora tritici-repentis]EDU46405.1 hypothetical protein PTRG_03567 [Pyrenophora tritici-repentis Pt-1C-BFP]KAF7448539.1 hypothetical protein A1F99_079030 [Pyrenophora tritici-repentis]KAF7572262.1 Herpes-BLLF1 domain containing protein [Pyrenophora tritici-repentis]KAG9384561.1 hypothetical protein A1F94_004108 [Pyrenophora tritici-repentis]
MLASLSISTLLLLASAAAAQDIVATSPFVSPTPTGEEAFTIQTSTPAATPVDPWLCYQACLQEPCPSCPSGSMMSILPVSSESVVTAIDPSLSTVTGIMSIPPLKTGTVVVSIITDPSLSTVTGNMTIPPLETPESSDGLMSIPAGETPISTDSPTTASSVSATRSAPAQVTTNAAVFMTKDLGIPCMVAVAGALALL